MNNSQTIGFVLLAVGAVLLFLGYQGSQSVGEQVLETMTDRFTDATTWYFVLGAAAALGGFSMVALRR